MERIDLMKYEGFESIDSSQSMSVYGGNGFWLEVIKMLERMWKFYKYYHDDFLEGLMDGLGE